MTVEPAAVTPRFGVLRPERAHPAVAVAEARVIRTETERRLGPVTLDLRIDGEPVGDWRPIAHASWPADIDATVDAAQLWGPDLPPLTTLFARTVEPAAASVRRRMLRHLGVLPDRPFDLDTELFDRLDDFPVRPTDLWLVATEARSVTHPDPSVRALATAPGSPAHGRLDQAFDRIADELRSFGDGEATIARLKTQVDMIADELQSVREQLARSERESADRLEQSAALNSTLRERLERAELAHPPNSP